MRKVLATALTAILAGCGSPSEPAPATLSGAWSGTLAGGVELRLTVSEAGRAIVGAGHWKDPERALAFGVSGARVDRQVSLLLSFEEVPDLNLHGEITEEHVLEAQLTGGTLRATPIRLTREQGKR